MISRVGLLACASVDRDSGVNTLVYYSAVS